MDRFNCIQHKRDIHEGKAFDLVWFSYFKIHINIKTLNR